MNKMFDDKRPEAQKHENFSLENALRLTPLDKFLMEYRKVNQEANQKRVFEAMADAANKANTDPDFVTDGATIARVLCDAADIRRQVADGILAPVGHAYWIDRDQGFQMCSRCCAECREDSDLPFKIFAFCPHCGAKMDEEVPDYD